MSINKKGRLLIGLIRHGERADFVHESVRIKFDNQVDPPLT
jgi:hypothetical protein